MKKTFGLLSATMICTALLAQTPSTAPQPLPPPTTPAPAAPDNTITTPAPLPPESTTTNTPAKKKSTKKKTTAKKTAKSKVAEPAPVMAETFAPNDTAVAKQNHVNVRGQARINSEVIGHLEKGEAVTVLEEVTLKHPATDEPAHWAKIAMPASLHAWINTSFIDSSNQTVKARKLNLRSGPGENYSVIGRLEKGDAVKTVTTKGEWTQIEPPTNAFAFVAAHLLTHKAPEATPIAANPPPPTPTPTPVEPPTTIAPPPTAPPTGDNNTSPPTPIVTPPIPTPMPPVAEQPLPKRVVEREGLVGDTVSIQAPSHYELKSLENGRVMDYLYSSSTNLSLLRYRGRTVLVSGEEELDERWPNTPVLTIQRIQVVQ